MSIQNARSPSRHHQLRWELLLSALCLLWPIVLPAGEIFRYQDQHGNWHFTDDPPDGYDSSVVPDITTSIQSSSDAEPPEDLAAHLQSSYDPITPVAYATLAVVSIRTDFGEGSGFFCSDRGHILTNKHVVRPDSNNIVAEQKRALEAREQELQTIEANLKEARGRLQLMERDLEGHQELTGKAPDEKTRSWSQEAQKRLSKRYWTEKGRISSMERSIRSLSAELKKSKREQSYNYSSGPAKKRFDIVLKDGTQLTATLLEASMDQDLALLKLDGYRTPFLRLDPSGSLAQGIRVFAIGNPLGMQAAVTSGVVTQFSEDQVLTDAQVLPGSSGGPLIRESGEVIGINVSRKVEAGTPKYAAGFGKAMPISLAIQAFPVLSNASAIQTVSPMPTTYPGPDQAGGFTPPQVERSGFVLSEPSGSSPGGTSDTAPVHLIVPGEGSGPNLDEQPPPQSRSLDFPPEGTWKGAPPGISRPQQ